MDLGASYKHEMKTHEIPFISSTHGRERRDQREIEKIDLQSAVKYGVKEEGHPCPKTGQRRWKYKFAGITYITDSTSTREITSYSDVLPPLPLKDISKRTQDQYEETKRRISLTPELITSHTVLIVDMSGSMNKNDMFGHRTRSRGVYFSLAEEYVANHLNNKTENNSISFTGWLIKESFFKYYFTVFVSLLSLSLYIYIYIYIYTYIYIYIY